MTKTDVIVFSISGVEGTVKEPKLSVPLSDTTMPERVAKTLADIAQRRTAKEPVVLMADAETPMQRVAEMIAAIRPTHPDIQFSTGFE
jgi:biopolymer transport protein ExbD